MNQGSPLRKSSLKSSGTQAAQPPQEGEHVKNLKRNVVELNVECERLRNEIVGMAREMDLKDDKIRHLERRASSPVRAPPCMEEEIHTLRHETDTLRQENTMLRDRVNGLNHEADRRGRSRTPDMALETEVRRLRAELDQKHRDNERLMAQIREQQHDQDKSAVKQKQEWNDLYGSMKRESDDLKRDIRLLNQENERLMRQAQDQSRAGTSMNTGASASNVSDREVAKRLKKRELECQALWETLKDMHNTQRGVFDARQMLDILSLRALDTKAKRKLNL